MSVTYGFFNAIDSDRVYNADQMSEYFKGLITDGVYESVGNALYVQQEATPSMNVKVGTGRAIINCKWLENDAVEIIPITAASVAYPRYTAVVVRLDMSERTMSIVTKDGTPSASPVKPQMTNTDSIKEICLAMIYVSAGVTSITQANIQDTRGTSLCGWITGLIRQVDTSELYDQYQTAFEEYYNQMRTAFDEWFADLTDDLNVDTYIQRYEKHWTYSSAAQFNPTGYTYSASDIIDVYINGLRGDPTTDYTLSVVSNNLWITLASGLTGAHVDMYATKSLIGFSQGA